MKIFLSRLLAYIIAGLTFGTAARLIIFDSAVAKDFSVMVVAVGLALVGVCLVAILLTKAHSEKSLGIKINPRWTIVAMDIVCMIAAIMTVFFIVDGYADRYFDLVPGLADPLLADVIAFMFLPSALVLALFVTSSGTQSVLINKVGLVVSGPFGAENITWDKIKRLKPNEQYVVVSRLGIPISRHLRTNLELVTSDGKTHTIYQPELKSKAKIILKQISEHSPARLSHDIDEIERSWI